MYLDERRGADEKEVFLKAIMECQRYVEKEGYRSKAQFNDFFTDRKPALLPYFGLHKTGIRYELRRDTEAINTDPSPGWACLCSSPNADISGEEALRLYREKDGVEKCFDSLKNNLSLKRLRVHSPGSS